MKLTETDTEFLLELKRKEYSVSRKNSMHAYKLRDKTVFAFQKVIPNTPTFLFLKRTTESPYSEVRYIHKSLHKDKNVVSLERCAWFQKSYFNWNDCFWNMPSIKFSTITFEKHFLKMGPCTIPENGCFHKPPRLRFP